MNDDLTSGAVVRGLSTKAAFSKDEVDRDERLVDASVNAVQGNRKADVAAQGMTQANFSGGFASTTVERIVAKGGRVRPDPQQGNANHCQVFGLPLRDANNLFSHHQPWSQL
ncbi:MAG: hypothetical protein ACOYBY_12395 [Dermatophilaceae bacterium]